MAEAGEYQVVARKYRPQGFGELVGQPHIAQGLSSAIATNRVGHAYLFTGARGTGKTSTARIFAKALNCRSGPTAEPCQTCDICAGITSGDDLDVIEIDAASNRGIDEIRQLRANAGKTPSRARYKIYIVDEVHMLTKEAFNALLKTLEEPPQHVKFILCTTDPEKIPITVLSRCQRFDFMPVSTAQIRERLAEIATSEGATVEPAALEIIARRAAGSMRDSQSLLEQLLSVAQGTITADDVHRMLGTADSGRVRELVGALVARNAQAALSQIDEALAGRVDAGQLAEQLLNHLRDMLTAALGASPDILLAASPDDHAELARQGTSVGIETLLAMLQTVDQALVRMRQSAHPRVLLEMAVVRLCQLEQLDDLSAVIQQLQSGTPVAQIPAPRTAAAPPRAVSPPPAVPQKKTEQLAPEADNTAQNGQPGEALTAENTVQLWQQTLDTLGDIASDRARLATIVAIGGPNHLVVSFPAEYSSHKEYCERPATRERIEKSLGSLTGQKVRVEFVVLPQAAPMVEKTMPPPPNKRQLMQERQRHPLVEATISTFGAEMVEVNEPRR